MEKRRYARVPVQDISADLSDGIGCGTATICNVSRNGLCLKDLGKRFGRKISTYTLVTSDRGRNFKFRVRPRWETADFASKQVGVEIADVPRQWVEYVIYLEACMRGH